MPRIPARSARPQRDTERELRDLQQQADRSRRALEALQNLSVACRGSTTFAFILAAAERELRQVFSFDACYIAVCDAVELTRFRAVFMYDEGVTEYREGMPMGTLTGVVVAEGRPMLFGDLVVERDRLEQTPVLFGNVEKPSRAWLGVPLLIGPDAIGVISIQSYEPNLYTEADVELLQRIGNVLAVVIENARLDLQQLALSAELASQVSARTVELATLSSIAAELVAQQSLPTLVSRALELVLPLLDLQAGTVRLIDSRRDQLVLLVHHGFPAEYKREAASIPIEGTAPGTIVRENRPLVVEQGFRLGALSHLSPYLPYVSMLGVPLRIGDRVLGALSMYGRDEHAFSPQTINLAQAIGNQIAIAIENARLFEAQERQISELQALGSISRAASTTLDLPTLLRQVHDELRQFLRLDAFSMVVYDPARGVVTDGISIDEGQEYTYWRNQPPPDDSLTAWIIRHRASLLFRDSAQQLKAYPNVRLHRIGSNKSAISWLGVPLLSASGDVVGVISIQGYQADAFDERDEAFLTSVAAQVALHVQNAQLLDQRERQIRELDAIGQIGQLISASYDFEEMLHGVYTTINEVIQPSVFYLLICEPETRIVSNAIFIENGERIPMSWVGRRPEATSITAWILEQREPLLFQDITLQRDQLRARGIQPRPFGPEAAVHSWIGVPLLAKDSQPIGVVALQDYASHCYDDQTIDFLSQVATHVSLGVQKVRLFEERERQLGENARLYAAEQEARRTADTLREVARVLSNSLDPREVLELMLRELQNVIAFDTASIMLLDGDWLRMATGRGFGNYITTSEIKLSTQRSAAAIVVQTRAPVMLPDITQSPDWMHTVFSEAIRSWLGVPLIAKGVVLGVLNIDSHQLNYFTKRDADVAQAFANQAALALERARLYEESVTRVEQELEIARQIQRNLFPHTLPQIEGLLLDARCIPARETGGDFFDVLTLGDDGSLALFIGDASGKSIPGAMLMAIAHSIVRSEARDHQAPAQVMREANTWIAKDLPPRSFVALCYSTLNMHNRQLTLANAGQLTPILRRADGGLEYLEVSGPRLPLGILPETHYEAYQRDLAPGDLVVLFTDGIVEAQNNRHELFGFERLEALLAEHGGAAPNELLDRVLAAVGQFTEGTPPHDDMTIVALRMV